MEREDLKSIVESLLFVADGPVTLQRLQEVLEGASKEDIRSVLDELQRELDTQCREMKYRSKIPKRANLADPWNACKRSFRERVSLPVGRRNDGSWKAGFLSMEP